MSSECKNHARHVHGAGQMSTTAAAAYLLSVGCDWRKSELNGMIWRRRQCQLQMPDGRPGIAGQYKPIRIPGLDLARRFCPKCLQILDGKSDPLFIHDLHIHKSWPCTTTYQRIWAMVVLSCKFPANKTHRPNVGSMLERRRRRRANIDPTLGGCVVCAGKPVCSNCLVFEWEFTVFWFCM